MNKEQAIAIQEMRRKAQSVAELVHVCPVNEEKVHTLVITRETCAANFVCQVTRTGQLCFCEPEIEDYSETGGGQLIFHRQVHWQ